MGEFGRLLTNLGLAYGLMNKDQFIDVVSRYAQSKEMSEEKMMELVENIFEELEITHRRRQAQQMFEAYEMKKRSEGEPASDIFGQMNPDFNTRVGSDALVREMRKLRKAMDKLTAALTAKPEGQ